MLEPLCWGWDHFIGAGTWGTSALASGLGEFHAGTAAPPQGSAAWKQGTVGAGCVCPLPPHRDGDREPDPGSPCLLQHHHPGGRAPDNSDVAPELLNPILIQPSRPNPTAMKKKAGNGWGPDPAAPQQRARFVTKPAEVTYPWQGQAGDTPTLDLGAVAPSLVPKPSSQCGPVALGGASWQLLLTQVAFLPP